MVKLLFFDMLQKVAEPIDDATKDFSAAFVQWLNKIKIVSCDLDDYAVNYSRATVARIFLPFETHERMPQGTGVAQQVEKQYCDCTMRRDRIIDLWGLYDHIGTGVLCHTP
jgi:hypothetical protein